MRNFIPVITAIPLLLALSAPVQGASLFRKPFANKSVFGPSPVRYSLTPRAEWQGDSLWVRFSGDMVGGLRNPESLHLAPVYVSGGDTIRYPELCYFTPSGAKYHKRREALADCKTAGKIRILYRSSQGDANYRESVLVPPSMRGELRLLYVLHTCCEERLLASEAIAVPERAVVVTDTVYTTVQGVLPLPVMAVSVPLFETNVTFIKPKAEAVKERTATATIRITYPVNHWKVYPDFENNREELRRIDRLLAPVTSDTATYRILSVSITGYASPEDTWEHNMTLSEKRAGGMRDYLTKRYALPEQGIAVKGRGEDWDGLREAIKGSDMVDKDEILTIIDSYNVFDGREKILMSLRGGESYRYMLQKLYPPLRRMEMKIDYRVRAFGTDEAGKLIDSRPQDLSLQEMYEVAQAENDNQTIMRQRNEYGREYDIAVRYFPNDDIANINASSAALVRGDLELARFCLDRVKENPMAANNLGVYHWLCGKIAAAKEYFRRATETDPERAFHNLEQLHKWEVEFGKDGDYGHTE